MGKRKQKRKKHKKNDLTTKAKLLLVILSVILASIFFQQWFESEKNSLEKRLGYKIIQILPHDPSAFTQGLIYYDNFLYESTGMYGNSELRQIDPNTGVVVKSRNLDLMTNSSNKYFGEGMTYLSEGRVLVLTYKSHKCFIIDLEEFKVLDEFEFKSTTGEGWGITVHEEEVIVTDGSDILHYWSVKDLKETHTLSVKDNTGTFSEEEVLISRLNELEMVEGELFANIWYSPYVARISPSSVALLGYLNFSHHHLPFQREKGEDTFNGIAYDSTHKELYLTGKYWRYMIKVKLL